MTAATSIERSGPAIRSALARHSPDEARQFENELRRALTQAGTDLDLRPVEKVLDRWWGIAVIRTQPLSDHEQDQLARARHGDEQGLLTRTERGDWIQL